MIFPFSTTIDDIELGAAEITAHHIVRLWVAGKTRLVFPNDVKGGKLPNDPTGEFDAILVLFYNPPVKPL